MAATTATFTVPEKELMVHLLKGKTATKIAEDTKTPLKLVLSIRHSILQKTKCENQIELIAKYSKHLQKKCKTLKAQLDTLRGENAA